MTTVSDLQAVFVDGIENEVRQLLFGNYLRYSEKLKEVLGVPHLRQWIDGSFVTKTPRPGDIDLVTFVDYSDDARLGSGLQEFKSPLCQEVFGVDAYLLLTYPDGHQHRFYQISDEAYWMDHFVKTRRKDRSGKTIHKGFLEVFH